MKPKGFYGIKLPNMLPKELPEPECNAREIGNELVPLLENSKQECQYKDFCNRLLAFIKQG